MSPATVLYLIRHGETLGNAERIFQIPETPLSDRGLQQAERLAARMVALQVGHIVSSDYQRAATTAEAIASSTGASLEVEPLLRERNFGELRGTPYAALDRDPFAEDYVPPRGESWSVFRARVERLWTTIEAAVVRCQSQDLGPLAIVTHGLVCDVIVREHTQPIAGAVARLHFGNTSLTILGGPAPWRVERLACVEHLDAATQHDGKTVSGI